LASVYDDIDLKWSWNGDFDLDNSHDLKDTSDDGLESLRQDIHTIAASALGDWEVYPNLGAGLDDFVGEPNLRRIGDAIHDRFRIALTSTGLVLEEDLDIPDIYKQYEMASSLIKKIPKHIQIIICPGNHDAMRIAEPQPVFYKDMAKPLWDLENVLLVSNPAIVTIHKSDQFEGFKILLYHGYSFTYYADSIESIRSAGGVSRSDIIMKFLLKRRHLAPTHTSNLYIPETQYDPLVISTIPDFFVTGHVHTYSASTYRNITCLNCSCWITKTPFQEKMGIEPSPARILVSNLQTREIKVMKF